MTRYQKFSNRILLRLIFFAALCILFSSVFRRLMEWLCLAWLK